MSFLHKKHFTLAEAQTALPSICLLLEEIMRLKRKLDERGFDIYRHQYFGGTGPNGDRFFPVELERMVSILKDLQARDIVIVNLEEGLIVFPHLRSNNEEVYLCWKLGEKEIQSWCRISKTLDEIKPLNEL